MILYTKSVSLKTLSVILLLIPLHNGAMDTEAALAAEQPNKSQPGTPTGSPSQNRASHFLPRELNPEPAKVTEEKTPEEFQKKINECIVLETLNQKLNETLKKKEKEIAELKKKYDSAITSLNSYKTAVDEKNKEWTENQQTIVALQQTNINLKSEYDQQIAHLTEEKKTLPELPENFQEIINDKNRLLDKYPMANDKIQPLLKETINYEQANTKTKVLFHCAGAALGGFSVYGLLAMLGYISEDLRVTGGITLAGAAGGCWLGNKLLHACHRRTTYTVKDKAYVQLQPAEETNTFKPVFGVQE